MGQHTAALRLESEQERFFRILLHDDRNSYYIVSSDAGGEWSDTALKADSIPLHRFDMVSNYYVTHNGFTGRRRLDNRTRQLNALFFDLDCHGSSASECEALIKAALGRIEEAVRGGSLPNPTMIVDSGRGVHLYYVLEHSVPYRFRGSGEVNEKGVAFFLKVQEQLADVLEGMMEGLSGMKVDRAVFDHARVARIPGTRNKKAGRIARLVTAGEAYHHLSDLASYKPAANPSRALPLPMSAQGGKPAVIMNFHPLMMSRLNKVAELQAYRGYDCEGSRELMAFVYYNTAVQVYSREDARERLSAFNRLFKRPLPQSELKGIERAVDGVVNVKGERGYYVLKADTLARLLSLTEREMLDLSFFSSKRMADRMEAKRRTKEKRDARNRRIVELCEGGSMTRQEVARAVGCSLRTVHSVLKEAGLTRRNSAPKPRKKVPLKTLARETVFGAKREGSSAQTGSLFRSLESAKNCPPCLGGSGRGEVDEKLDQDSIVGNGGFLNVGRLFGYTPPPLLSEGG